MKNIAVIFGGKSTEHDISIITGLGVIKNLGVEYDVVPIYVDVEGIWWTGKELKEVEFCAEIDTGKLKKCYMKPRDKNLYIKSIFTRNVELYCVINAMHGGLGENGGISGVFETSGVPETSSGILGNAICMDKYLCKMVLRGARIPTQKFMYVDMEHIRHEYKEFRREFSRKIGFPCILKPSNGGSSIGIAIARNWDELDVLLEKTKEYENRIVIEKYIDAYREINISAFMLEGNVILSNTEEVVSSSTIYDYTSKYSRETKVKRISPAVITEEILDKIARYTKKAYRIFDCGGVVRFDYFVVGDKVYLNEVNTIPGSMAYYLWKNTGYTYARLMNRMIAESVKRNKRAEIMKIIRDTKLLKELKDKDFRMSK